MKAPSQRQMRVGELVRHGIADILLRGEIGGADLDSAGIIISEVAMSPDLKIATAYVRAMPPGDAKAIIAALDRNRRRLRGALTQRLHLKFMPEIRFRVDTASEHASKIDALLRRPDVARDLAGDRTEPE